MQTFKRWIGFLLTILALAIGGTVFADKVCRCEWVEDKDGKPTFVAEANRAKRVIGIETTSDINECKIFLTMKDGELYAHSNFITPRAKHPTKIVAKDVRDLLLLTANIYTYPEKIRSEMTTIRDGHEKQVKFYLDQNLFDPVGRLCLDPEGAQNLSVLFGDVLLPKTLVKMHPIRGPPWVAEYHPSLFVKVTNTSNPRGLFRRLEKRPFKKREMKFACLLGNSAIERAIKGSAVEKVLEKGGITSADGLANLFRRNKGKVVVLLGHSDGKIFLATGELDKQLFTIPLAQVARMAEEAECDSVILACHSAKAGIPVGVDRGFSPVGAVERLNRAIDKANYYEFVRTLASRELGADMGLVFDETAFKRSRIEADVYDREVGSTQPLLQPGRCVGRLLLAFGIGRQRRDNLALEWKFVKDKPIYQKMTTETNQTMKIMNNDVKQKQTQTFYFSWTPEKQDGSKWIIRQKIIGVTMDIDIGGSKISYDSTKEAPGNNALGEFFKALVGSEFKLTLDTKTMKVTDVEGREKFVEGLVKANPSMKPLLEKILSKQALIEMAEPTFALVPDKPVAEGDEWTRYNTLDMGPIGKYENKYTYTFEGKDPRENKLDRITVETSLQYNPPINNEGVGGLPFKIKGADLKSKDSSGTILFDAAEGRVQRSEMKLEMNGKLSIEIGGTTTEVDLYQIQETVVETSDTPQLQKR